MPLYEFKCQSCGHTEEVIFPMDLRPLERDCPACGERMDRLISAPAIRFKGKGWTPKTGFEPV